MKIGAITKRGERVYIVQFVPHGPDVTAVTVNSEGELVPYSIRQLTVIDLCLRPWRSNRDGLNSGPSAVDEWGSLNGARLHAQAMSAGAKKEGE